MAIAASAPVLPNQEKQCCKIARFTDAPCINLLWLGTIFLNGEQSLKIQKNQTYKTQRSGATVYCTSEVRKPGRFVGLILMPEDYKT